MLPSEDTGDPVRALVQYTAGVFVPQTGVDLPDGWTGQVLLVEAPAEPGGPRPLGSTGVLLEFVGATTGPAFLSEDHDTVLREEAARHADRGDDGI
ncbi:hypothetical protein [Streptomyces sp. TS71-3]|uniref:hypothetical protein n=1 Tax=Streptomyces sp. TS71-3 TaxID=2733862 RepID=UPI001B0B9A6F|nr:hypothetical protein [Streptomyces sp. TS71-3]GHJ39844.1 hypothetical protein Sm713_54530 [Streptomyces sp. TS71-3]